MLAAVLTQPGRMQVQDVEVSLPEDKVLVAVASAGICATDVHAFAGNHPFLSYPRILGHEVAGTIAAVGSAVRGVAVGDRVVLNPYSSCDNCRACRRGFPNLCPTLTVSGIHVDGGFAEYVQAAPNQLHHVPADLDLEIAALAEPLSIGAEAVAASEVRSGDHMVVLGAGPIGLATLAFGVGRGATVAVIDRISARLVRAKELGAAATFNALEGDPSDFVSKFTHQDGADVVVEAVGVKDTIEMGLQWVAAGGCFVLLGLHNGSIEVPVPSWFRRGLRLVASRMTRRRVPEALEYMVRHPNIAGLITHRTGLHGLPEMMATLGRHEIDAVKVLVLPRLSKQNE